MHSQPCLSPQLSSSKLISKAKVDGWMPAINGSRQTTTKTTLAFKADVDKVLISNGDRPVAGIQIKRKGYQLIEKEEMGSIKMQNLGLGERKKKIGNCRICVE